MANPLRFPINRLMLIVLLAAVNLAIIRWIWDARSFRSMMVVALLPMTNVLLLVAQRLRADHPTQSFWLGFEVGGVAAMLVGGLLTVSAPQILLWPLAWLEPRIRPLGHTVEVTIFIVAATLYCTVGLLVVAVGLGKLSARYRVVIVRR